jgi:hypothetical protein
MLPYNDTKCNGASQGYCGPHKSRWSALIEEVRKFHELVRRYLFQMLLNPGIVQIRLVMYTMLSLFLGALFFNLETDYESKQSINSHAALLFYSSSFYIFMVCATLPFLAIDLQIRNKVVLNGLYHPMTHHLDVAICTIPACLILSLVISVIWLDFRLECVFS